MIHYLYFQEHTLNSIQLAQDCRALDAVVCAAAMLKLIIHNPPKPTFNDKKVGNFHKLQQGDTMNKEQKGSWQIICSGLSNVKICIMVRITIRLVFLFLYLLLIKFTSSNLCCISKSKIEHQQKPIGILNLS